MDSAEVLLVSSLNILEWIGLSHRCPENLLNDESDRTKVCVCDQNFDIRVAKIEVSVELKNSKFWLKRPLLKGYVYFSGPAGGLKLTLESPILTRGLWRRSSSLCRGIVQAIFLSRGVVTKFWSKRQIGNWSHVLNHNSGSVGWIRLRFC